MVLYWNIFAWSFLIAALWRVFPRYQLLDSGMYEKRANIFIAVLTFGIIIFFAGLRSGIADTATYIYFFNSLQENTLDVLFDSGGAKDKGFTLFTYIIKLSVSDDFHVWLFIIALLSGLAVMLPLYKHSPMFELSTFLFIATSDFTWMLNGMRQFIAISLLFAAIDLIVKKKTKTYLLIILLLSTIHGSAIFLLPFCFICHFRPWSLKILITICIFMAASLFANQALSMGEVLLEGTQYAGYTNAVAEIEGSSSFRLIVAGVPLLLALYKKRKALELNDKLLNVCINMSTFNFGFMLVSTAVGGIFVGRLAAYFGIYNLLLYPLMLTKLFNKSERVILYVGIICCYIVWFYYQMVVTWKMYYISDILDLYLFD